MSVNIESTTDSKDQVLAAIGGAKSVEKAEEKRAVSSRDDESQSDESEQEESETSEENLDDDSDSSTSEDDEEIKDELKEDQKPKKRSGFQRRIDKFQKKLSEKDQEIEQLKKAASSGAGKPQEQAQSENLQPKVEAVGKPDPNTFDSHQDYVEALTDWKIEEKDRLKEVKAKEAQFKTEFQKQVTTFQSKVAEFSKATPDFDDVVSDVDDIPLNHSIQDAIITSEFGPALMYELSKNREQLLKLNSMSPVAAAREIGRIEARLSSGQETTKPKEIKLTKTPPPIEPVGSKSSGKNFKSPDDMSLDEYRAWRNKK